MLSQSKNRMISADHHRCECVSLWSANPIDIGKSQINSWVSFDWSVYVHTMNACWFYSCMCCRTHDAVCKNHSNINRTSAFVCFFCVFFCSVVVLKCWIRMICRFEWITRACNSHGQRKGSSCVFFFFMIVIPSNSNTFL